MDPKPTNLTFADVQAAYDDALLLEDRNFIKVVAAAVIANQLEGAPVWLMLVAPSSGGKTAVLLTLDELEFVTGKKVSFFISDLTENTFASGFKSGGGDASLLNKVPYGGLLIFKDFTSILTKRHEARDAIMGQMREIFDRKFDKSTGNNQDTAWRGKLGALAGVTTAVHEYMSEMSVMGDRFIMYSPKMPDRKKLLHFMMDMKLDGDSQEKKLDAAKELMHAYLKSCLKYMKGAKLQMKEEDRQHLMDVADFATKVRSGVITDDRRGLVRFVPEPEMPTRLIEQLLSIGTVLSLMHEVDGRADTSLDDDDMKMLYKIAFDSIPVKRRWALRQLASYAQGATTAGIAAKIGYETEVVKEWLAQLNALGICTRLKSTGSGDTWLLNEEYIDIMTTFENVEIRQERLIDESASEDDKLADEALYDPGDLNSYFDQ
jgi:hypothetical protein